MSSPHVEDINVGLKYSSDDDDEELRRIYEHTTPTENSSTSPNREPRQASENPQSSLMKAKTFRTASPKWDTTGTASSKSDFADVTGYEDESDVVLALAKQNYETFYKLNPGTATAPILEHSSAGIAGWASCALDESPSTKAESEHGSNKKRKLAESPPTKPPPRLRKCDEEEARELQLALLESLGVDVGVEAKRSLIHDTGRDSVGDQSEDEGDWSMDDDDDDDDDGLEDVSLKPDSTDEGDRDGETGLSPLTEGLCIAGSESEADSSQDSASGFVVVRSQGKRDSTGTSSFDEEADRNSESGLSPLTKGLRIDSSEDDSQDSAESFVNVSAPPMNKNDDDADSSSSNDWALL